jgi:hypothetical protein
MKDLICGKNKMNKILLFEGVIAYVMIGSFLFWKFK